METCNDNKALDLQLKTLGMENRKPWDLIAKDDREFSIETIVVRPDWVFENRETLAILVTDYKNRLLGENEQPSLYEQFEIVINCMVVKSELEKELGREVDIAGALVYGNRQIRSVEYDPEDEEQILQVSIEMATTDAPVPGTLIAEELSGADFSGVSDDAREKGIQAHKDLMA